MKYIKLNCSGSMDSKFMVDSGFSCSKAVTTAAVLRAKIRYSVIMKLDFVGEDCQPLKLTNVILVTP